MSLSEFASRQLWMDACDAYDENHSPKTRQAMISAEKAYFIRFGAEEQKAFYANFPS